MILFLFKSLLLKKNILYLLKLLALSTYSI